MNDFAMKSKRGKEMLSFLPGYYETSRVMKADMDAKGAELDSLYAAMDETLDQFFVKTATWGLGRWEAELGIPPEPGKPVEQRRALVESRLRGAGNFTGRLVKNVAESYDGGTVNVTFAPAEYSFTIRFVDTIGIPPNLEDLKAVIEEIKPAHMAVEYEFSYLLIRDIEGIKTLNQLEKIPLSKFAGGV
ncbi:YmfQ family protein [Paenibacillus tuaregi]|uniref:YmfQ family protein n=1 Tax=Paenibacillus tuaregi TaxID=1816681 RepID=UPI00083956EA|nr:YmfQ family protein [Paenibacillus tuaregi]